MWSNNQVEVWEEAARRVRQEIIQMLLAAGSGHSAGPLGMADVFTAIYLGGEFNLNPKDPWNENRDRVILSNGHICPVWYATLAEAGYFPKEELLSLRKLGSRLQGHPHYKALPGVENTGGPLAQGISQAVGQALAARMDKRPWRVVCLMSDGELQEGQVWEAFMWAGKNKLANLTVIVDRNKIQIDGFTEDVMPLEPLLGKFEAFNWGTIEVDGHSFNEILEGIRKAKATADRPTVIIAQTTPGKGVDFMEGRFEWHGKVPNATEAAEALRQLGLEDKKEKD